MHGIKCPKNTGVEPGPKNTGVEPTGVEPTGVELLGEGLPARVGEGVVTGARVSRCWRCELSEPRFAFCQWMGMELSFLDANL